MNKQTQKMLMADLRELFPNRRPHRWLVIEDDGIEVKLDLDDLTYEEYCIVVDTFELGHLANPNEVLS